MIQRVVSGQSLNFGGPEQAMQSHQHIMVHNEDSSPEKVSQSALYRNLNE